MTNILMDAAHGDSLNQNTELWKIWKSTNLVWCPWISENYGSVFILGKTEDFLSTKFVLMMWIFNLNKK